MGFRTSGGCSEKRIRISLQDQTRNFRIQGGLRVKGSGFRDTKGPQDLFGVSLHCCSTHGTCYCRGLRNQEDVPWNPYLHILYVATNSFLALNPKP